MQSRFVSTFVILVALSIGSLTPVFAEELKPASVDELLELDIEQLTQVEIFSASKKLERLDDVPAAVFIITAEDIRRSTANSIPELLRLVPGLHVARISTNVWSISSRGFNGRFSDKLLVLIDGRAVYNPLFSGVYWNVQDTMLEDIERIEVIRGPGGTLWGANAVNGVINIITKNAKQTTGLLFSGGAGSEELGFSSLRYGKSFSSGAVRAYSKFYSRDDSADPSGGDAYDKSNAVQGGFRADLELTSEDSLNIQGDIFSADEDIELDTPTFESPTYSERRKSEGEHRGGNVLAKWTKELSEADSLSLQLYYSRDERRDANSDHQIDTYDVDLQHSFSPLDRHTVIWGAGYRLYDDEVSGEGEPFNFAADVTNRDISIFNVFAQDSIQVTNSLRFLIGSKLSHNDYSGFELQPSVRSIYRIGETSSLWAAVSRAVRTPNRVENDIVGTYSIVEVPDVGPVENQLSPNRNFRSENLIAYEIGYRALPHRRLSFDIAAFLFDYDDLVDVRAGEIYLDESSGSPALVNPLTLENDLKGMSYGGELLIRYLAASWWKLQGSYSTIFIDLKSKRGMATPGAYLLEEDESPEHMASLRSTMDLPYRLEFDAFLRFVDRLKHQSISSYSELDLRLGWKVSENLSLDLIGNNLLKDDHDEFDDIFPTAFDTRQERGVFAKLTLKLDS